MINKYIEYLRAIRGYSKNTCESYRKDLTAFAAWVKCYHPDKRWSTISRDDIDDYVMYLESRNLKPSTTNRALSSCSGIYNYFIRQNMLTENPVKFESRRKNPQSLPNTIPLEDLKKAYENADGDIKLIIGILAESGIRISEMLLIRNMDIDIMNGRIRVLGKGNKERYVYISPELAEEICGAKSNNQRYEPIFKYTQRELRYMLFMHLRKYSTARQLSPHAIRHTFATNLAANGVNISTIAGLLGHNQLATTQRYIDSTKLNYKQESLKHKLL